MANNMTGERLETCDNCDMIRLEDVETGTVMGTDGSPLHTGCRDYVVNCEEYGRVRACENCEDIYLTDDLTTCETYGHGTAICRPCHENAGGSWRCYTER